MISSAVMPSGDLTSEGMRAAPPVRDRHGTDVEERLRSAGDAQKAIRDWPERRVDLLLTAVADAVAREAHSLARDTVDETGMGRAEDKARKNVFSARQVAEDLVGRVGCGIVANEPAAGVVEVASPVGVVLALLPVTTPVATLAFTALIALKSRNALLARPHPRAARVTERAVLLLREVLRTHDAPADLLQVLPGLDRSAVQSLMRHPDVDLILATGSSELVKAAAQSGTPSIGAGSGNAPVWICADADDVERAAGMVVNSKAFDHGIICGSEQHLVVQTSILDRTRTALDRAGAAVLTPDDVARLEAALFAEGRVRPHLLGRSPAELARCAGITLPPGVRLLVAPLPSGAVGGPWGRERLVPVLGLHAVPDEPAALELCTDFLRRGGAGHTAAIHTRSPDRVMRFAHALSVSRVIVNGPASQGCIGLGNGLVPSFTLACGPAGGAVTTDNITYRHLQVITRIALPRLLPTPRPGSG